jgi:hypothetical protein
LSLDRPMAAPIITRKDASMMHDETRLSRRALAVAWLLAAAAPIAAEQTAKTAKNPSEPKVDLRYKFRRDETVRAKVVHRATVETSIQGTSQTVETRSSSIKVWRINDVSSDGVITFVHSFDSVDMWQQTQGRQEVRYNSLTDKEAPPGYEEMAKAVGVPLTEVTMDRTGKILKRKEKFHQANVNSMPMAIGLPDEPVAVGAVWTAPLELDVRLSNGAITKVKGRYRYTLEKVADGVAVIQLESQVLTPINDPAIEAQLIQRLPSGSVRFDIAAGRVIAQQMDLDKRVIGFSGPASNMHCLTRLTEELLPSRVDTVERLPTVSASKEKGKSTTKSTAAPTPRPAARETPFRR